MKVKIDLFNQKSIDDAIKKIDKYRNSIMTKTRGALKDLGDAGIQVAVENSGKYGAYISFTRRTRVDDKTMKMVVVGKPLSQIHQEWQLADGSTTGYDIDPLLMAEFGSGLYAESRGVDGVGRGTHPKQKHANNDNGWAWKDLDGTWHHSKGQKPTAPMYKAQLEMEAKVEQIFYWWFSK